MPRRFPAFMSELPQAPELNPVRDAIAASRDPHASAALQSFAGMPPSTGVFANPVRYHHTVTCNGEPVELSIRSFGLRGCLLEEDIVAGAADAIRTIFVGLFARFPTIKEAHAMRRFLIDASDAAENSVLPMLASFMTAYPDASADIAMQHISIVRKAQGKTRGVRGRSPADLLGDLIQVHMESALVGACSSYMRALLHKRSKVTTKSLIRSTRLFLKSAPGDPFNRLFTLLLRRSMGAAEATILQTLGAIQIHHGSAGSNMVTRYLASLHSKSVSDIFTAGQMALDCSRHFGAITDMTEFIADIEHLSSARQDQRISERAIAGSLPTFGHPEIAAAGRSNRLEIDPRPAIYLASLFEAIDSGKLPVSSTQLRRIAIAERMYQIAFVEGIEKPGRTGRLRIAPNTDFGAWIVQESLGIETVDRTFVFYVFRGFGWMMDVGEEVQQPIIRPVIPPGPATVPTIEPDGMIPM